MSLKDVTVKREYRSQIHEIARDFYIPLLSNAVVYDRAVGFFSSSILSKIISGITELRNNGGKVRLVVSPNLSDEDIQAIRSGYKRREDVIVSAIRRDLKEPVDDFEKEHLNILANLIADGVLDIKVAVTDNNGGMGMYHEKMGLISDVEHNTVAFSGSMNESTNALVSNYETIDVYCSWKPEDKDRVADKRKAFDSIWNDTEKGIKTIYFPELKQEIIDKYRTGSPDWHKAPMLPPVIDIPSVDPVIESEEHYPILPEWFNSREYQDTAIANWASAGYRGIFDMATGTGKTLTALEAITKLEDEQRKNDKSLAVIVVVPYQHLVEQWVEDIEKFNIRPIIGYSSSQQRDWMRRLDNAIRDQKAGVPKKDFFLFVCTNATFVSEKVQSAIQKIRSDVLLVVDEAHNAGAPRFLNVLTDLYTYRLALSATIDRHNDAEGTQKLFDFFGEKCIEYTLEEAIAKGVLTKYYYYPILTYLTPVELDEYLHFTLEISKCMVVGKDGKKTLSERGKRLALKRARIVSGAQDKLTKLETAILPYKDKNHILVYCGSTTVATEDHIDPDVEDKDERQIVAVSKLLGNKLNMRVSRFTSEEDMNKRALLKEEFADGANIQALIAIRCLDEGVNIPAIKTAFILASTTNPKEYIQRRGRVLRTFKDPKTGKEKAYAEIFDFITLPRALKNIAYLSEEQRKMELSLIKRELARAEDFARLAINKTEARKVIDKIKDEYSINEYLLTNEEEYL